jgi:Uncharacterized protein conserved in bacteria (DUF2066)
MTLKPWTGLIALILAALCAFAPTPASAQGGRDNVFSVSGVQVDQTAENAAAAQEAGYALAKQRAFERLVRRITIAQELAGQFVAPDPASLEQLVLSISPVDERRSGTRYIGRFTVRFDPAGVRALLRGQNLTLVESRTSPTLVAPMAVTDTVPETAALWRDVWSQGGFRDELAPLLVAPDLLQGPPDWRAAQPYAQAQAAASALYATLRVQGGVASATLVEVSGGPRRDRGEVTARLAGEDQASLRAALTSLAEQASARLQNDWKSRATAGGAQRTRVSASALYGNQRQWETIKQALEGAAQTLISEIRIEAVGREGALVSFSFMGERAQLIAELARRGVRLDETEMGPVLRTAGN